MTSFRRRESAKQNKRKTGKREEFDNSKHYEHKVRKMIEKDKSAKYKRYDSEDI